jgi:hexosaminidase
LESLGLNHVSAYEKMLERLAAGGPVAPIRTLAEVVEPVKDYARGEVRQYDSFSPYNRLIDALPSSGENVRQFATLVDNLKIENYPKVREWLTLWHDNDARLQLLVSHSALLDDDVAASKDLSAIAEAGLEAMDRLQGIQKRTAGWIEAQTALLDRAKLPKGELLISVEPSIRKLVEAAR